MTESLASPPGVDSVADSRPGKVRSWLAGEAARVAGEMAGLGRGEVGDMLGSVRGQGGEITCPHGNPVLVSICSLDQQEKRTGKIKREQDDLDF